MPRFIGPARAPAQVWACIGLALTLILAACAQPSGAPGGQFDEECARTALGKIKDRMK